MNASRTPVAPLAATDHARLAELVPISMSSAQVAKIAAWAAGLVARAVAQVEAERMPDLPARESGPACAAPSAAHAGKWRPEDDARLREMLDAGAALAAIAEALGRTRHSVRVRQSRLGLAGQTPAWRAWSDEDDARLAALAAAGRNAMQIAGEMGRTAVAVRQRAGALKLRLPKTSGRWSPLELASMMQMRAEGVTSAEIGARLGRSEAAVEQQLHRVRLQGGAPAAPVRQSGDDAAPAAPRGGVSPAGRPDHANGKGPAGLGAPERRRARAPAQSPVKKVSAPVRPEPGADTPAPRSAAAPPVRPIAHQVKKVSPSGPVAPLTSGPVETRDMPRPADIDDDATAPDPRLAALAATIACDITRPPRPVVQRAQAHLDRMAFDMAFDAATDLRLLIGTSSGVPVRALEVEMGLEPGSGAARVRAMIPRELRDPRGHLSIDGQRVLLEAAKRNALE